MKTADLPLWLGVVLVLTLILLAANLVVYVMLLPWPSYSGFTAWLDRWQALIAGVLALVGAIGTVYFLYAQIRQAGDVDQARKSREELAAKTVLPLALSQLANYAGDCIRVLAHYAPPAVPAIYFSRLIAESGGLIAYGTDFVELVRQAAGYIDRILKGAKPADPRDRPSRHAYACAGHHKLDPKFLREIRGSKFVRG
jgi:hypothetical protein